MGNAVNRTLNLPCDRPTTTAPAFEALYFVTSRQDPPQFDFTKDLAPVAKVAASRIYALKNHGARINQEPTNILLSEQKVNYMTYLPARLEQGLNISLPYAPQTIVRVALRCGGDTPIDQQNYWKLQGAEYKKPLATAHSKYLGSNYYDLEWTLTMSAGQGHGATISSTLDRLDCDVSAIARPVGMQ